MSEGIPYADIVILALIAGFILLRLRSVLGRRDEGDQPNYFNKIDPPSASHSAREPVVHAHEKPAKTKPKEEPDAYLANLAGAGAAGTLQEIKTKDPMFSATIFLQGARMAFEMVFDAFAKGDKSTLKMLLSDAIYEEFSREIEKREVDGNKTETTLVSVKAKDIAAAALDKNTARLTVKFESEQVTVVRDAEGKIVEGDPSEILHVSDEWVFERDVTSKNPNWKIIET